MASFTVRRNEYLDIVAATFSSQTIAISLTDVLLQSKTLDVKRFNFSRRGVIILVYDRFISSFLQGELV